MAATTLTRPVKGAAKGRVKLPVKRSVNLAGAGEKPMNMKIGIPAIILILIAAAALSKFGVIDRYAALSEAQGVVRSLNAEIKENYDKIERYADLEEKYAHYTYTGMTQEELSRVDRTETVKIIERVVLPAATLTGWSIKGNQLSLTVNAQTLQEINLLAQRLETEDLVDYCQVTTAATEALHEYVDGRPVFVEGAIYGVTAQITAFLSTPEEEG